MPSRLHLLENVQEMAGNMKTIIENAVKNAEITDFIMLVRNGCITVISVEDFIKDITLGGQAVCDTLLNCWKTMGQFDGGVDPENGDNEECDCSDDFVKIHFPKGEGIKVITAEEYVNVPDSIYIRPVGDDKYEMRVVDEEGNERSLLIPEIPTINYPVTDGISKGDGIPLYRGLASKKIEIASLKSDSFIITEELDSETNLPTGVVEINAPGGGSNSNDYFLDVNFSRPSNWDENAESIDGIKTAKGTLNDPFKSFEEYLRRCVDETGGSNGNGPYSRINPKNPGKRLQLLSNLTTDKILEVNQSPLILNKVDLVYNGPEIYSANTERLWDAMSKTAGVLNRDIYYEIGGEGSFTNLYHFGCVNHKTSVASTTASIKCLMVFSFTGLGINFFESPESASYTDLTKGDGTPYLHGGIQAKGSLQAPVAPLIRIDGQNKTFFGASFSGTIMTVQSNTQTFIECVNGGSYSASLESIKYLVNAYYVGYEKKLYTGLSGITADETELLIGRDGLFFKPYSNRKIFSLKGGSLSRIERISTIADERNQVGVDAVFHVEGGSTIDLLERFVDTGGGNAISFLSVEGNGNSVSFYNVLQYSYMNYFVKGDGANTVNISFKNSQANNIFGIKKNVGTLNVDTDGTWSSIKKVPINTGIASFANNAAAVAANYITGMSYFNTTENAISRVS